MDEMMVRPVLRDEHGPVSKKTLKELLAKVDEERLEWLEKVLDSFSLDMLPCRAPVDDEEAEDIAEEWADMVTATVTLMDALGISETIRGAAIVTAGQRNLERGRL